MKYQDRMHALLSPAERAVLGKLSTPHQIQDYLDSIKINFPAKGMSVQTPRQALASKKMHCVEGAAVAAAALAYHGHNPLLLDIKAAPFDLDHVVALFSTQGRSASGRKITYWGAISKTNHPVLRWRDPIYKSVRELAMSYAHEYFWPDKGKRQGVKTILSYSRPFNLKRYDPSDWFAAEDFDQIAADLDDSPHYPIVPKGMAKHLRKASAIELKAMSLEEWKDPRK
jgi:hypothetical protein